MRRESGLIFKVFDLHDEIWQFYANFWVNFDKIGILWPYLGLWVKNQKNKGTFFSRTLKLQESKVVLLFQFLAPILSYDHFLKFRILLIKHKFIMEQFS